MTVWRSLELSSMTARFLWLDLETTGLDPDTCTVLEVAAIVTTADLQELDTFEIIVAHDIETLQMTRWPWKQHTENGLLDDLALMHDHDAGFCIEDVDDQLAVFIREYSVEEKLRLAGSSVHFDRSFMRRHLPRSLSALHYRQFDVSVFHELHRWMGVEWPVHDKPHRAMPDIENSLKLARHFKELLSAQ
jgi:oligoribonuclease